MNAAITAFDAQGTLYGFTMSGGGGTGNSCNEGGCGTIFKIAPSGETTVLRKFNDGFDHKGARVSGIVLDGAGTIYGTTINGGAGDRGTVENSGTLYGATGIGSQRCAVVFKIEK